MQFVICNLGATGSSCTCPPAGFPLFTSGCCVWTPAVCGPPVPTPAASQGFQEELAKARMQAQVRVAIMPAANGSWYHPKPEAIRLASSIRNPDTYPPTCPPDYHSA